MASSLIPINQATPEELQSLKGIGAKRAGRIIKYREEVADIMSVDELSTAAGLSLKQANALAEHIEWLQSHPNLSNLIVSGLAFIGSYLLIFYGFTGINFEHRTPAGLLLNVALLLILLACASTLLDKLIQQAYQKQSISPFLRTLATSSGLAGIGFVLILVSVSLIPDSPNELSSQTTGMSNFLLFTFLIMYLIYAPGFHLNRVNPSKSNTGRHIRSVALGFDLGQLGLGLLVLVVLFRSNSPLRVEEIFSAWAGMLLISNGIEMIGGRSAYLGSLSPQERDKLNFLLSEASVTGSLHQNVTLVRITGTLILIAGAVLICLAAFLFFAQPMN